MDIPIVAFGGFSAGFARKDTDHNGRVTGLPWGAGFECHPYLAVVVPYDTP